MKLNLRWQLLLAVLGFILILALLSYQEQVQSVSYCTITEPAPGGTFVEGVVGAPRFLNPLLSDSNPVDQQLVSLIFDGLTRYDENGRIAPALAQSWQVSDDGLTVTFTLRDDAVWQDGEPVTANDVAFTYGLMADPAFPGATSAARLWQSVTINVLDAQTVQFVLTEPYSPFLQATTRGILPAHRLEGVTAVTLADHPFNQSPVGTGPFMVQANQNPQLTGSLTLTPNPLNWPQIKIANLEMRFFPDETSLLAAYAAGEIHAIDSVSPTMLPEVAALPETRLFTATVPRYTELLFNVSETGVAVPQLAVRQALAYALDREQLVDAVLHGQGVPLEGPYLPSSWAYNASLMTRYTPDLAAAQGLLDGDGWLLPEGQSVRQRDEETLTLRLLLLDKPTDRALAEAIAAQWSQVGVAVTQTRAASLDELRAALASREFDVALLQIAPPADPDLYDFWSQEAIIRGNNYAGWNQRRASEALESGRQTWGQVDRKPFYDVFLRRYDEELPALTLYQHVDTYALSTAVHEVEIGRIDTPRDRYQTLADWFLLYQDVEVLCPDGES
ncbi:MAG: peptide ABC transporter substrate-binding protein [Ardenticatenaceae bacterium]|nr:peptide ABC transporter substrate-binding protein [Ardenticatenaceae bacterium]